MMQWGDRMNKTEKHMAQYSIKLQNSLLPLHTLLNLLCCLGKTLLKLYTADNLLVSDFTHHFNLNKVQHLTAIFLLLNYTRSGPISFLNKFTCVWCPVTDRSLSKWSTKLGASSYFD